MPDSSDLYYVVVIRHSMYGDTPISGEITGEVRAKGFCDGVIAMHDQSANVRFEKVVLISYDMSGKVVNEEFRL